MSNIHIRVKTGHLNVTDTQNEELSKLYLKLIKEQGEKTEDIREAEIQLANYVLQEGIVGCLAIDRRLIHITVKDWLRQQGAEI